MSVLPALPVLLLVLVVVWFFWPVVVDPIARAVTRRALRSEADRVAEHLFETWSEQGGATGLLVPSGRG